METDRPSVETIIGAWIGDYGIKRLRNDGQYYIIIKASDYNLEILADTFVQHGYTFKEMHQPMFAVKIAKICWDEEEIIKMSRSEIGQAQKKLIKLWGKVISRTKFSGIEISKAIPKEYKEEVKVSTPIQKESSKEELLEKIYDDTNRLVSPKVIDRSSDINWELLEELGIADEGKEDGR